MLLPRAVEIGNIGIDMIDASNNPLCHKLPRDGPGNDAKATLANLRFVSLQKNFKYPPENHVLPNERPITLPTLPPSLPGSWLRVSLAVRSLESDSRL